MIMKGLLPCLMVLFFAAPLFAQDQAPSADEIVSKMQSKLNLTPDQVTAVTPIIQKYASKHEELRQSMEDGAGDRDSMRTQMKQLREDEKQELSQVLSAAQLSQWGQMMGRGHKHNSGDQGASGSGSGDGHEGGN